MRGPPNYTEDDEDEPPYLLGVEEDGATVWRLLLDARFMDPKYFNENWDSTEAGSLRWSHTISVDVLAWLLENDPDYRLDVLGQNAFVIRFTNEVPAMGFRLRYDARIAVDTPSNREVFGLPAP